MSIIRRDGIQFTKVEQNELIAVVGIDSVYIPLPGLTAEQQKHKIFACSGDSDYISWKDDCGNFGLCCSACGLNVKKPWFVSHR